MAELPGSPRTRLLFSTGFATLLQLLAMILLATDKISGSEAVPILGIVLIFGLLPAIAFVRSRS